MNEVTLHRGGERPLVVIDAFFDGQHLTEAVVRRFLLPLRHGLRNAGRWIAALYSDWFDSILPRCRGTDISSGIRRFPPYTDSPEIVVIQNCHLTWKRGGQATGA